MVVATHDPTVAAVADRVVRLVDGQVTGDRTIDAGVGLGVRTLE
jgi:ABC-type lipoprotein export system ATPase subunit